MTKINKKSYYKLIRKYKGDSVMNKIVAVVGMCGSGKSVAVEEFEKRGFKKVYFGAATMNILKERNLPVNEENERKVREELRASGDKGIYAKIFLPEIKKLFNEGYNIVIESLYSWSEYKHIKEEFGDAFSVLAIITNTPLRRIRLESIDVRPMTKIESLSRDYAEIENIEKGGPIAIADFNILNNSTKEEFLTNINNFLDNL